MQVKPAIYVTYNGDWFDWPFIETRAKKHDLDMHDQIGFRMVKNECLSRFAVHMDCLAWVNRDSYLPQGSRGLKVRLVARQALRCCNIFPSSVAMQSIASRVQNHTFGSARSFGWRCETYYTAGVSGFQIQNKVQKPCFDLFLQSMLFYQVCPQAGEAQAVSLSTLNECSGHLCRLSLSLSLATTRSRLIQRTWSDLLQSSHRQWRPIQSPMRSQPTISTCPTSTPSSSPSPPSSPCPQMKCCAKVQERFARCFSWCKPTRWAPLCYGVFTLDLPIKRLHLLCVPLSKPAASLSKATTDSITTPALGDSCRAIMFMEQQSSPFPLIRLDCSRLAPKSLEKSCQTITLLLGC